MNTEKTANVIYTLIINHMPLVNKIAYSKKKKLPLWIEVDDLISSGFVGLTEAANRFEQDYGCCFSTYAFTRINGAMDDYLRGLKRIPLSLDFPEEIVKKQSDINSITTDLKPLEKKIISMYYEGGYTLSEIGEEIGVKKSWVCQLLNRTHKTLKAQNAA